MKRTAFYPLLLFVLLAVNRQLLAQTAGGRDVVFSAEKVELDNQKNTINLLINALFKGRPMPSVKVKVIESLPGKAGDTLTVLKIDTFERTRRDTQTLEKVTAVFLVDLSDNMDNSALLRAKTIINDALQRLPSGPESACFLVAGLSSPARIPLPVTAPNTVLDSLALNSETPDLCLAINRQMRFLRRREGKQLLFVLSNGKNQSILLPNTVPDSAWDVARQAANMGLDFYCFPIGLGEAPDVRFLQMIVSKTKNSEDVYSPGLLPAQMGAIIRNNVVYESTHLLRLYPKNTRFEGETRVYKVWLEQTTLSDTVRYVDVLGSSSDPFILGKSSENEELYLLMWIMGGVLLLAAVLVLCSLAVPAYRRRLFRNKFVRQYKQEGNLRRFDPLTNEPIREGEWVVAKCRQITPLATWNGLGHQCPNYPDCMHFNDPCNGSGAPEPKGDFFSMQGIYRKLNWMWFGALGGFVGWMLFSLFKYIDFTWYRSIVGSVLETLIGSQFGDRDKMLQQAEGMTNNTLIGISFGIGLVSILAWMTERAQSRALSLRRILLRTVVGVVLAPLVFIVGFYVQYHQIISSAFLSGLLSWILFGVVAGLALSIQSNISAGRGILGGVLACTAGYLVFSWLGAGNDFTRVMSARLFGLIVLGSLLGVVVETVYTTLEEFELEIISPTLYRHTVHISKWLKSGLPVIIGRESGSFVYVKWDDPAVEMQHARLSLDRGKVYIEPYAETLLRGQQIPLNKRTQLQDGDVIQLGAMSISRFKYVEKRKEIAVPTAPPGQRPAGEGDKPGMRIVGGGN